MDVPLALPHSPFPRSHSLGLCSLLERKGSYAFASGFAFQGQAKAESEGPVWAGRCVACPLNVRSGGLCFRGVAAAGSKLGSSQCEEKLEEPCCLTTPAK